MPPHAISNGKAPSKTQSLSREERLTDNSETELKMLSWVHGFAIGIGSLNKQLVSGGAIWSGDGLPGNNAP
jgi:hypothetical protein